MSAPLNAYPCAYPFVHFGGDSSSTAYPASMEAGYPAGGPSVFAVPNHSSPHYGPSPVMNYSPLPCAAAAPDGATVMPSIAAAAAYAAGGTFPSLSSLELPAGTAAASADFYACAAAASANPMSDLYFCSPHPHYAESPLMPPELYGAGAGGGSLVSSASLSGSRFPQWYLPRGYCAAPSYAAGAASSYGGFGEAGSTGITPTSVSMAVTSAEDDMLGSTDVRLRPHAGPQPPRLAPQVGAAVPGHFTLPPPASAGAAAAAPSPCSTSLSLHTSPATRGACTPHFVAYDGRAYGLPLCPVPMRTADALHAVAQSPLIAAGKPVPGGRSPVDTTSPLAAVRASRASLPKAGALHHQLFNSSPSPTTALATPRHRVGEPAAAAAAAAAGTTGDPAQLCSPGDSALLADVHTRLLLQREQQRLAAQKRRERAAQRGVTVKALCSADLAEAAATAADAVVVASVPAAGAQPDEMKAVPPRPPAAAEASEEEEEAAAAVATLSPIPRVLPDADTESVTEAAAHSHGDRTFDAEGDATAAAAASAAAPPTQDVLDRVLMVPGVVWRHDPYSRRVLPTPDSSEVSNEGGPCSGLGAEAAGPPVHCPYASSLPTSPLLKRRLSEAIAAHQEATASATPSSRSSAESSMWKSPMSMSSGLDATQPQPSARRRPTKTVCVRHYVTGDGDGSGCPPRDCSGVVGALATVREVATVSRRVVPRPAATVACRPREEPTPAAAAAAAAAATSSPRSSANTTATAVVAVTGSAATAPTTSAVPAATAEKPSPTAAAVCASSGPTLTAARTPPATPRTSPAAAVLPAEAAAASAVAVSAAVPSEHPVSQRGAEPAHGAAEGEAEQRTISHSHSSHSSSSSSDASSTASASTASSSEQTDVAAAASAAAAWPVARPRPKPYSSPLLGAEARTSVQVAAACWAWQLRSARVYPPPGPGDMGAFATAYPVDSFDDIDTAPLLRLWHRLTRSGCYRDALARRQKVIGEGSNSSTRLLRRVVPLPRRVRNRRRGLEVGHDDAPRFTVLEEAEMQYVYVLHHRYRRSTAVGCECFAVGTTVVVDGDMGIETGTVELVLTRKEYVAMSEANRRNAYLVGNLDFALASSIHRAARVDELEVRNTIQTPLEDTTLEFLRFMATQPHLFRSCRIAHMTFIDVEFQADGQKLYVHYTSDTPVRFLELATYLNHVFHCRIWMRMVPFDSAEASCSGE